MKILLAEDDDVSRHILRETLSRWGYEVVCAPDGVEAWQLLQEKDAPKLAILDWIMPGMDGIDVCRNVRAHLKEPYVYILLLTAKGQKEDVIKGMGAGADDYVSKPFDPQELRMRLSAGRRIVELQAELVTARESLRYMATHDSLTGLVNRAEILDRLQRELDRSDREKVCIGVLLADIDHFKIVNDTLGHTAGDRVLTEVGSRMRTSLRSYDVVGRYGGEEFLIILPGCDGPSMLRQAERVRSVVADQPVTCTELPVRVSVSIGAVSRHADDGQDLNALVRAADAALYRAKGAGRNQVALAEPQFCRPPLLGETTAPGSLRPEGLGSTSGILPVP
jgi:two-component system, cell cycle response regulator